MVTSDDSCGNARRPPLPFNDAVVGERRKDYPCLVNVCTDRNRSMKVLRFDEHGRVLFGLCEPVEPQDPHSTNLLKPFYERHLQLIRISLFGQCTPTVCRNFVVRPVPFFVADQHHPADQSSSSSASVDSNRCARRTKLRDMAYGSSENGHLFGVVYLAETGGGNVSTLPQNDVRLTSSDDNLTSTRPDVNPNARCSKRYLVTIDVQNDARATPYQIVDESGRQDGRKRNRLKLFHLSGGVGWVLAEVNFDTEENLLGAGGGKSCEFLTFYKLKLDDDRRRAYMSEIMTYSADQYYVHLTSMGSKIYIFRSSDVVNVYDAAQDIFCSSVHLPVNSSYIFKMDRGLYLLPPFRNDLTTAQKDTPKCLLVYDGKRWQETEVKIDDSLVKKCDSSSKVDSADMPVKDLSVAGSSAGFFLLSCSKRSKIGHLSPGDDKNSNCLALSNKSELVNEFHFYRLTTSKDKRTQGSLKRLQTLTYEAACSFYGHEQILDHRLPPDVFRRYYGPEWQRANQHNQQNIDVWLN